MLNNRIIAKVQGAFVNNCVVLLGRAYDELRVSGKVNHDMNENTVSENLRRLMTKDQFSAINRILVAREQPIDNGGLLTSNQNADTLPRIDFQFQKSWSMMQRQFVFYMEAKNLYANDFKKTGNSSVTLASTFHKRYVETGIMHLLTGYYPSNTYLLGYVLEGTVADAVVGVNAQISSLLLSTETLRPNQPPCPSLSLYKSTHNQGRVILHLMMQF